MTGASIAMMSMLAMLSLFAATILSRPWMRYTALALGCLEIGMIFFVLIIAYQYR